MQRTVFLVDSENVADHWIGNVTLATSQDRIIIFWSRNSKGISLSLLPQFLDMYPKEQLEFVECYTGTNSMDFHIVAKLGHILAKAPKSRFVVVSDDAGYDGIINHLYDKGFSVARLAGCKDMVQQPLAKELRPELVLCVKAEKNSVEVKPQEVKPHTAGAKTGWTTWGTNEKGVPYRVELARKHDIDKKIDSFFRRHPEATSRRKDIVEILSTTIYPCKKNTVAVYERLIKLPNVKITKMAAIYRAMKQELLPVLDGIICEQTRS